MAASGRTPWCSTGCGHDIDSRLDPDLFGIETVNLNNTGSALSLTEQNVIDIGESNSAFTSADSAENLVVEGTLPTT